MFTTEQKDKARVWYLANRERLIAKARAYNNAHREEIRAKGRAYYAANRERKRLVCREYYVSHKDALRKYREANRECRVVKCRCWYAQNKDRVRLYNAANHEKRRAACRKYEETHREKRAKYREEHRSEHNAKNRLYRLNNYALLKRRSRELYRANPAKFKAFANIKARALLGRITQADVDWLYSENLGKYGVLTCELCFRPIGEKRVNIDHKVPVIRGGTHDRDNLHISDWHCNRAKGSMTLEEWRLKGLDA